jgi:predicted nucleic acid-binding protein
MLSRGTPRLLPLDDGDLLRMRELMSQYQELPMDLADAALVRVAERGRCRKIFKIDRRDFRTYRPAGIGRFTLIP